MKRSAMKPGTKGLKCSAMSRGSSTLKTTKPMQRASKPMKAVGQRGTRMRQGKVMPTRQEAAWMDAAASFGCIVCHRQNGVKVAAEIHHLKQGDRRMGHLFSIGLCYAHHRGGASEGPFVSRHPWKVRFENAFGTEMELLAELRALLGYNEK